MLILTRKCGERILIGEDIIVEVCLIESENRVKIGIQAPRDMPVFREEIVKKKKDEED